MAIVVSTKKVPQAPANPVEDRKKRRQARVVLEGGVVILALLFGLMLRVLAFEGVLITSGSMEATLRKGDYSLVDHRVALRGSWKRGDIVLFEPPSTWSGTDKALVKRVVGLPGEEVVLMNGQVYINRLPITETYLKEKPEDQDTVPLKLGPNQYFVLGDNRNNSDDSRENGPISEPDIRGRILTRLWPISRFAPLPTPEY
jgi:signal peptidase I